MKETENGTGIVRRNVIAYATRNKSSSLLVKNPPIFAVSRVLFNTIHGGDNVPLSSVVGAVVVIERAPFVSDRGLVQDVDQQRPILYICDVTCWNGFAYSANIPVHFEGD